MPAGKSVPCPKCGRPLAPSGELTITDDTGRSITVDSFQCDECLVKRDFMGEEIEIALTFAVDSKGQPFDPAADDGRLRF